MKGSLIVLAIFIIGILIGVGGLVPDDLISSELSEILLYLLVVQIGLSLGSGGNLGRIMKNVSLRSLSLPLCTVLGTLFFTAVAEHVSAAGT